MLEDSYYSDSRTKAVDAIETELTWNNHDWKLEGKVDKFNGYRALMYAVINNNIDMVNLLYGAEEGPQPSSNHSLKIHFPGTKDGKTPLMYAIEQPEGYEPMLKLLLDLGDLRGNRKVDGTHQHIVNIIDYASKFNKLDVVKTAIKEKREKLRKKADELKENATAINQKLESDSPPEGLTDKHRKRYIIQLDNVNYQIDDLNEHLKQVKQVKDKQQQ